MQRARTYLITAFILFAPLVFVFAQEGLVPCDGPECQFCHLTTLFNNILAFLVSISAILGGLAFVYAGFLFVTAQGSEERISRGKGWFSAVGIGFILVLGAWLIINTIFQSLTGEDNWGAIRCTAQPSFSDRIFGPPRANPFDPTGKFDEGWTGTPILAPNVIGTGNCGPSYMQEQGWATLANSASCICQQESAGIPNVLSRTDRGADGNAFSAGLFQINMSVNKVYCGSTTYNCPAAFSGKNYNSVVVNQELYNTCLSKVSDGSCASQTAQGLYNQKKSWGDWSTAGKCGLQ